jgi:hypothetical protein
MSSVTFSPSPILLRHTSSTSLADASEYHSADSSHPDDFFGRRRTSHPHNAPVQFQAIAEDMSQRLGSGSQLRPRLEHQASRTLIDLTEEDGDDIHLARRDPPQRPPQLGRSDAQRLADIIDLTEDDEEIQITGTRHRELPLPRPDVARPLPHIHPPRRDSPHIFFGFGRAAQSQTPNPDRDFPAAGGFGVMVGAIAQRFHVHGADHGEFAHFLHHAQAQAMPGQMDYRHPAFADRKPDHVRPEPAKSGFTRSPTESDTIICPSCEQELVHNKDLDEPVLKKSGKAPNRKDREEHPFWVVKNCGHVSLQIVFTPVVCSTADRSFATTAIKIASCPTPSAPPMSHSVAKVQSFCVRWTIASPKSSRRPNGLEYSFDDRSCLFAPFLCQYVPHSIAAWNGMGFHNTALHGFQHGVW